MRHQRPDRVCTSRGSERPARAGYLLGIAMSAARASALPMAARTRSAWSTAPLHPSQRSLHIRSARPDRTGAKLALVVRGGCRGPPPSRRATGAAGTAARGRAAAQRCSALPSDLPLPTELALLTLLVPPALG